MPELINRNNIFDKKREDRSSLRVIDQYGNQVLKMRYMNPQTMFMDIVLHYPSEIAGPIRFSGSEAVPWYKNSQIGVNCIRGGGGGIGLN